MRNTGYVWHERYAWHDTGTFAGIIAPGSTVQPFHNFESPESKSRLNSLVEVSNLIDHLTKVPARVATDDDILRVHTPRHLDFIKNQSELVVGDAGDGFSPFGHKGIEVARLAAGGTIAAVDAVLRGDVTNAYALVRPPGHHAERDQGMGYCIFANIPIAIEWARSNHGIERIAVVDFDIHHGNGTQSIFAQDPNVLTISLHQDRLFPQNTGAVTDTGGSGAEGSALNIPLPAGTGNGAYSAAFERLVVPALRDFKPEAIFVASGFDASAMDPLGCMTLTATAYRHMTAALVELAGELCNGRLIMSHEGGYSPVYVPYCGLAVLEELCGFATGIPDPFEYSFGNSPAHVMTQAQDDVLIRAETIARQMQLIIG
jgi:acetoin utilization deacetylase AcuC-like enzyme